MGCFLLSSLTFHIYLIDCRHILLNSLRCLLNYLAFPARIKPREIVLCNIYFWAFLCIIPYTSKTFHKSFLDHCNIYVTKVTTCDKMLKWKRCVTVLAFFVLPWHKDTKIHNSPNISFYGIFDLANLFCEIYKTT